MDTTMMIHEISASNFIYHCQCILGWRDLSNDLIMDVGCGEDGFCGKEILKRFPDTKIIFMDKQPQVIRKFLSKSTRGVECVLADIEDRESFQKYEGKMTKVVSTHVFHQLMMKEKALQNVYHLLKPGGEAAILFVIKSLIYDWLTEMLKIPKWKGIYQGHYVENLYKSQLDTAQYKEMAEKIGFQVIECLEEKRVIPSESDEVCKESLYRMAGCAFKLSPDMLAEFKNESFEVILKLSARDEKGKACYRSTELTLLLVKPADTVSSDKKDNVDS